MFQFSPYNALFPVICLIITVSYLLSGCNQNSDQREFERAAFSEPSGINDPDDWRIAPFFQVDLDLVQLPHPNPVQSNDTITINIIVYTLDRISGIYLYVWDPLSAKMYYVDHQTQITTGTTTFRLKALEIAQPHTTNPAGLYRLIIQDETENLITYGDIEIE